MRGAIVIAVGVLWTSGCETPPGLDAAQVCDAFCDCAAPLPTPGEQCRAECAVDLAGFVIPDACMDCLEEDSCGALEQCFGTCVGLVSRGAPP